MKHAALSLILRLVPALNHPLQFVLGLAQDGVAHPEYVEQDVWNIRWTPRRAAKLVSHPRKEVRVGTTIGRADTSQVYCPHPDQPRSPRTPDAKRDHNGSAYEGDRDDGRSDSMVDSTPPTTSA
jgi:hypothetical protein